MDTQQQELPKGWRWAKLGEVAHYINGMAFKPENWKEAGIPIIRIQNLNDFNASFNYTDQTVPAKYYVTDGDLLISWSASLDAYIWQRGTAILNQHIFKVVEKPSLIDKQYLYFAARDAMDEIRDQVHGATMRHITRPEFEAIKIPLPPLAEQRRIAATLREHLAAVEAARAAAQVRLAAAQAMPAALLREVFESEEAQGWERRRLGEVCEIIAKQVDPKLSRYGVLPHINGENIESGTCRLTYLNSALEDGMTSGKYFFEPGDVLYSKLRPYLRKVVVVDFQGLCSADMYPIKVYAEILDPHFLGWLLVCEQFSVYADEESRRARMPKLNREQLFAWEAPIPSLSEQRMIVNSLKSQNIAIQNICAALQSQLTTIEAMPAALLRMAFAGEL